MPAETSGTHVGNKPRDAHALINEVTGSLRETAAAVVPWFLESMPLMYFQDTDHATQLSHIRAIIAAKASGRPIELNLRSEDGSEWTMMRPLDYPGVLAELVSELPVDRPLNAAKIHTATDGQLVLDTFEFGEGARFDAEDPEQAAKLREIIDFVSSHESHRSADDVSEHANRCTAEYVLTVTPLRFCRQWDMFDAVTGTDGAEVLIEPEADRTQSRITLAAGNSTRRTMLERVAHYLSRKSINIHRAYLDIIDDASNGAITLLGFVVQGPDGGPIDPRSELWRNVEMDLRRLKWLSESTLAMAYRNKGLSIRDAEIIKGLCYLAHQYLVKVNRHAFDRDRVVRLAERNLALALEITHLFLDRFNPEGPMADKPFAALVSRINDRIEEEVDLEDARSVLHKLVEAVQCVLRTNVYLPNRYGLSMRIDPNFLNTEDRANVPFGVFFVYGRNFVGFHVRFRDIARGGVRAVRPVSVDQHAIEAERLYDEAYGLASAQQLKNKDIPEGGAKAAILLEPEAKLERSVKGFVDAILDLIAPEESTQRLVVDRIGHRELLYLGPDENITPLLIEWIVDRARRRGYPTPTALMSSKPSAGINHKMYGVTSEGVTVFLEVALETVGIKPRQQPFTVKITGGPDGDVAGNEIKILHREFGENARIVGIADGSGAAEDPDGLNHAELLRLVDASLPIARFDKSRLGKRGVVRSLDDSDGVKLRNTLHNRIVADAFVPAGGRPNAIHAGNWRDYLQADGTPSSKVIVEGANLFLTPEARSFLSKAGVLILKDSSANKCGVICSSFEIMASMLLSEREFLAIKQTFVEQVLVKLRELARREAELLMRIHRHRPNESLPEASIRLSAVMIQTADAIEQALDDLEPKHGNLLRQLIIDHLPPILLSTAGDRLWKDTPRRYLKWIMAKSLAARMVYREGFQYLEATPRDAVAELAVRYLYLELERKLLSDEVAKSNLPSKDRIAALLGQAGILSTLGDADQP